MTSQWPSHIIDQTVPSMVCDINTTSYFKDIKETLDNKLITGQGALYAHTDWIPIVLWQNESQSHMWKVPT